MASQSNEEATIPTWFRIFFPRVLRQVAEELGEVRTMLNQQRRAANPKYRRGEMESPLDALGILGELVARNYCVVMNIPYRAAPLVALNPVRRPDLIIGNFSIDVKTSRPDAADLLVNRDAHLDRDKQISHYWFVKPVETTLALASFVSVAEVDQWNVKDVRHKSSNPDAPESLAHFVPWTDHFPAGSY